MSGGGGAQTWVVWRKASLPCQSSSSPPAVWAHEGPRVFPSVCLRAGPPQAVFKPSVSLTFQLPGLLCVSFSGLQTPRGGGSTLPSSGPSVTEGEGKSVSGDRAKRVPGGLVPGDPGVSTSTPVNRSTPLGKEARSGPVTRAEGCFWEWRVPSGRSVSLPLLSTSVLSRSLVLDIRSRRPSPPPVGNPAAAEDGPAAQNVQSSF